MLDEREGVSYPDGVQESNGLISIIYDYQRYKEGAIFMASFREEDVFAGKCLSSDVSLKVLINKTGGVR